VDKSRRYENWSQGGDGGLSRKGGSKSRINEVCKEEAAVGTIGALENRCGERHLPVELRQ
jgi:hypothetical protein